MKVKITWLDWSLKKKKKKIQNKWENGIVVQGRVDEIESTSQVVG